MQSTGLDPRLFKKVGDLKVGDLVVWMNHLTNPIL